MSGGSERRLVLVVRRPRLDDLVARFNTVGQARFYVERLGGDFADYEAEAAAYEAARAAVERTLAAAGRLHVVDRGFVPNYLFGPADTVFVLGPDGLVANVLKYLDAQVLLGINPEPARYEGVLLPCPWSKLPALLPDLLAGRRPLRSVAMAQVRLNTGGTLLAVNDLFIGARTHTSARYTLTLGERSENQSSSGIVVSTGLGSTGWLRSILAGAAGLVADEQEAATARPAPPMPWDANWLRFSVREPWPSRTTQAGLVTGRITRDQPLRIRSAMPENGVIFSDGIEADFLRFESGTEATVTVAARTGRLAT